MNALLNTHLTAPATGATVPALGAARTTERFTAHGVLSAPKVALLRRNGADGSEDHALEASPLR